jgi:uncharacterized protein DUF4124
MRSPAPIGYLLACVVLLGAATPAQSAQLYKWVDERGVTNYSNQPPADPDAVKKLAPVEGNLSVYSPDRTLAQATEAFREGSDRRLADRVDYLERQLEVERLARQYAAAMTSAPAPCPPGVDCYGTSGSYYPAGIGSGFFLVIHKHKPPIQARPPLGAAAPKVVGMGGFILGQSALATSLASPRPSRAMPLERPQ